MLEGNCFFSLFLPNAGGYIILFVFQFSQKVKDFPYIEGQEAKRINTNQILQ